MSCQIADQLIQKFRGARTRQPAAQPKTLAKFRALQVRGFSVTCALITFLQLVNPLDSFLCVLHASCSVFIKGISSWGTMGFAFQFVFVIFFFWMFCLTVKTSNTRNKWTVAVVSQKRAVSMMRNEMKRVSETVYKNGTFIATERSCTWLHRITTDGNR